MPFNTQLRRSRRLQHYALLSLAVLGCLGGSVLLTGCGHSASVAAVGDGTGDTTSPSGIQISSSLLPARAAPTEKIAMQFFDDAGSGNVQAAGLETGGVQGDPVGQITSRVKTHGKITSVIFYTFQLLVIAIIAWTVR